MLPMAGIVGLLQKGVGHLMREAGLLLMMGVMDEEVRYVVGERYVPNAERQASRWGKEPGYCVVDGQKVPIAAHLQVGVIYFRQKLFERMWRCDGAWFRRHLPCARKTCISSVLIRDRSPCPPNNLDIETRQTSFLPA